VSRADTSQAWRPLSAREEDDAAEAYRALHVGVPPWLRDSIWEWVEEQVTSGWAGSYPQVWGEGLRQLERVVRFETGWNGRGEGEGLLLLRKKLKASPWLMLDVTDYLINHPDFRPSFVRGEDSLLPLDKLLEESGSAYKVAPNEDGRSATLIRRVDSSVELAAKRVMDERKAPSILLRRAWNTTFGLHPNPSDGYRQAVRAVEAAAIPVILPNDKDATLGRVIGTLRSNPDRWQLSFTHRTKPEKPAATLTSMMALLWEGQYDRHVSDGVPLHVSQEEAETAIHLAVTLVQWFTAGHISRRP
jgi:hypothetical protein